jgi:hypothetical protein
MKHLTELEDVQNTIDSLAARLGVTVGDISDDLVLSKHVTDAIGAMGAASTLLIRAQELAEASVS